MSGGVKRSITPNKINRFGQTDNQRTNESNTNSTVNICDQINNNDFIKIPEFETDQNQSEQIEESINTQSTKSIKIKLRYIEDFISANTKSYWTIWERLELKNTHPYTKLTSIKLSCGIQDQGWGNLKGAVDFKLCRGDKPTPQSAKWEWDQDGSGTFDDTVKREVILNATHEYQYVIKEFDGRSDFVKDQRLGDSFELWQKVGGGGGHELQISEPTIEFIFEKVGDEGEIKNEAELKNNANRVRFAD